MRFRLRLKKFITLALAMALLLCLSLTTLAADGMGSLTYQYPVDGVSFSLYQIGKAVEDEFVLTGDYAGYGVDVTSATAGETLAAYVERDKLTPLAQGTTENGAVTFAELPMALYLVLGEPMEKDGLVYTPNPVLLSIPQLDDDRNFIWDVDAQGKPDIKEAPETMDIPVTKIWEQDDEGSRPAEITVQLLCDSDVYGEARLNKSNNWSYTWTGLAPDHDWKLAEKQVPEGYTVRLEKSDGRYVLVNTGTPTPPSPPPPELPNTGQLWWPVGLLLTGGLLLVIAGVARRRRERA